MEQPSASGKGHGRIDDPAPPRLALGLGLHHAPRRCPGGLSIGHPQVVHPLLDLLFDFVLIYFFPLLL